MPSNTCMTHQMETCLTRPQTCYLTNVSGKDSLKFWGTNSGTWGLVPEGGRSYLWHPPAWLLVPVVRRTTTVTDVGCRVEVPTQARRALDGQFQSSRVGFKPGFVSHQAETSFTKGSGTPGLNLALEDWSCPPLGQHNTNHSCSCRVPRVADQSPARVLLLESDSD